MKRKLFAVLSLALLIGGFSLVPHVSAQALSVPVTETWTDNGGIDCIGAVNGAQTSYYGAANGDTITLQIANNSNENLNISITSPGHADGLTLSAHQSQNFPLSYAASQSIKVEATSTNCNAKGDYSDLYIEAASGSMSCNIQNNQVWNIPINYSNVVPTISLYRGSTLVASNLNSTNNSYSFTEQFSAQSSAQTYYLYNGTSSSARQIGQASCPAKTSASTTSSSNSGTPAPTPTPSPTTTPAQTPTPASLVATPTLDINASNTSKHLTLKTALLLFGLLGIAVIIVIAGYWKVFKKAGRPGWAAIVPIYSSWVIFELGGKPGWWALIMLIPFVGLIAIVIYILAAIEIARRFGKGKVFAWFGLIFFGIIGWPMLGFGKAQYQVPGTDVNPQTPMTNPMPPTSPTIPLPPPPTTYPQV